VTAREASSRYARGPHLKTPLQAFLDRRGIPSARIEARLRDRLQGRAPGRRKMARIRLGRVDPRRKEMIQILWAVREAAEDADVRLQDLFNIDPSDPENWQD
jgi:hypothetical protein